MKLIEIILLDDALEFIGTLPPQVQRKIYYNFDRIRFGEKDKEIFKKLEGHNNVWEFRTLYNGVAYRFLAFWDERRKSYIVVTHGFVKKTEKTPLYEINLMKKTRTKYNNDEL